MPCMHIPTTCHMCYAPCMHMHHLSCIAFHHMSQRYVSSTIHAMCHVSIHIHTDIYIYTSYHIGRAPNLYTGIINYRSHAPQIHICTIRTVHHAPHTHEYITYHPSHVLCVIYTYIYIYTAHYMWITPCISAHISYNKYTIHYAHICSYHTPYAPWVIYIYINRNMYIYITVICTASCTKYTWIHHLSSIIYAKHHIYIYIYILSTTWDVHNLYQHIYHTTNVSHVTHIWANNICYM